MEYILPVIFGCIVAFLNVYFRRIIKSDLKVEKLGWRVQCMSFMAAVSSVLFGVNFVVIILKSIMWLLGVPS